jgi:pimeloyl-ACP methyl ester carboxylesterase
MWEQHVPIFAEYFRVITVDSRGHGKTENSPEAFSYRTMADDVASFIQVMGLNKPFICGFSDGGQAALELGMHYPELAGGLIISAAWFKFSESYIKWAEDFGFDGPGKVNLEYIEREMPDYVSWLNDVHVSQSPDYWQTLLTQLSEPWMTPLNYTAEDFSKIIVPTLILVGDRDAIVPVEEAAEMYRLIPNAELKISPNTDHMETTSKVESFTQPVLDFLLHHQASND